MYMRDYTTLSAQAQRPACAVERPTTAPRLMRFTGAAINTRLSTSGLVLSKVGCPDAGATADSGVGCTNRLGARRTRLADDLRFSQVVVSSRAAVGACSRGGVCGTRCVAPDLSHARGKRALTLVRHTRGTKLMVARVGDAVRLAVSWLAQSAG